MTELDEEVCYRALASRDARFAGRFFVVVTSTGIYCRIGCPARIPVRKNVHFVRYALDGIAGIGPWTKAYIAMRLGDPDAFPSSDLVLRRSYGKGRAISARELDRTAEKWRPFRAYMAIHLWRQA